VGQRAEIIFDAFLQDEFTGSIVAIAPLAVLDGNAVYYVVTVYLDDIDERLRPNLTADVTIYVDERDAVLTVPNEAIVRQGGKQVVYVQNGDLFEARPVTIGWKDSKYTEIKSGLEEGEVIVVDSVEQIQVKGE
jgi:multidrug efflux pump subunit AcrA (membrane-fusion protein)